MKKIRKVYIEVPTGIKRISRKTADELLIKAPSRFELIWIFTNPTKSNIIEEGYILKIK